MTSTMPRNLKPIAVYVEPDIHQLLGEIAKAEDRPLSNLCARVLTAYAQEHKSKQEEKDTNQ